MEHSESSMYSELLTSYIENSGLSLAELAKKMLEEKGIRVDRSYISMLKNNKTKNPASDEVNRALAEITGGNPEKLVYAAYIEKAPEELKEVLTLLQGDVGESIRQILIFYTMHHEENSPDKSKFLPKFAESINNYDKLNIFDKLELISLLIKDAENKEINLKKLITDSVEQVEYEKTVNRYLDKIMPILSFEEDKFLPLFKEDITGFAKKFEISAELISTPNNLKRFIEKTHGNNAELADDFIRFMIAGALYYQTLSYDNPGFNKNLKIHLDKWLSDGNTTYKKIPLTESDNLLISIFIDALLKDRIDGLDNS